MEDCESLKGLFEVSKPFSMSFSCIINYATLLDIIRRERSRVLGLAWRQRNFYWSIRVYYLFTADYCGRVKLSRGAVICLPRERWWVCFGGGFVLGVGRAKEKSIYTSSHG